MPEQKTPPPTMNSLTTVEDERRLLEKQRLKTERKELRRAERAAIFKTAIDRVKLTAARQVDLKRYVFLDDEELAGKGLTKQQIAIVRQWEQPKRNAAFTVESSSKLIEAETRAQGETKKTTINVQNMVVLPEKKADTTAPLIIDVEPDQK